MIPDDEGTVSRLAELDEALRAGTPLPDEQLDIPTLGTLRSLDSLRPRPSRPIATLGRLGRFQLERELGRGGFGVVFLAHDPDLDRSVALKVPFPHVLSNPSLLERFRREARAAARLDHPQIVRVHDIGDDPPAVFIASECVPGGTLARRLVLGGSLPVKEAAGLVAGLAEAVAYAHDQGVIHRDIKPANVLLTADGTPRLTDFGLAAVTGVGTGLTHSGAAMGTPGYMAPEQARGREVGPGADVYGLGAVLYECLTGRPPFVGESDADTIQQVLNLDPIPPSRLRPGLPRDLETVALKCLVKEPGGRYRSAAELAADLRRFLAGEPVVARPVGPVARFLRRCRRRPTVTALGVALVAAIVAGIVGVVSEYRQAEAERATAESRRAEAVAALTRTDRLLGHTRSSLDEMVGLGSQLVLVDERREAGIRILELAQGHYRQMLAEGDDPAIDRQALRVCSELALAHLTAKRYADAVHWLAQKVWHGDRLAAAGAFTSADRLDIVRACVVEHHFVVKYGGPRDRRPWFLDRAEAHLMAYRAADPHHPTALTWHVYLWGQRAMEAADIDDQTAVGDAYEAAVAILLGCPEDRRPQNHNSLLVMCLASQAMARVAVGRTDEADRAAARAVELAGQQPADRLWIPTLVERTHTLTAAVRVAVRRADRDAVAAFLPELASSCEATAELIIARPPPEFAHQAFQSYHAGIAARVAAHDALGRRDEGTAVLATAVAVRLPPELTLIPCRPQMANVADLIERLSAAGRAGEARRVVESAGPLMTDQPHNSPADRAALARLRKAADGVPPGS